VKLANKAFENLAQFRYSGRIVINKNCINEKIKKLNMEYLLPCISESFVFPFAT
jgi:hypothetical protein